MNGVEVTGLIIMCMRKMQSYPLTYAMMEFQRFVKEGVVSLEETEFFENFRLEVKVSEDIPPWLWGGDPQYAVTHPPLRLELKPKKDKESDQKSVKKSFSGQTDSACSVFPRNWISPGPPLPSFI